MKALLCAIVLLLLVSYSFGQQSPRVYQINADTIRIYNSCDTAELVLENHTQDTLGFLYNKGKGRTEFRRLQLASVGTGKLALLGQDTIDLDLGNNYIRNTAGPAQTANFSITGSGRAGGYIAPSYIIGNYVLGYNSAPNYLEIYYPPGSRYLMRMASSGSIGINTDPVGYALSINCNSSTSGAFGLQLVGLTGSTSPALKGDVNDSLLVISPASNVVRYAAPGRMLGAALKTGTVDFPAGTTSLVINTTAVTTNSRIFLTVQEISCSDCSTTPMVITRSAGTSFTVRCLKDASISAKVAWMIVEPG